MKLVGEIGRVGGVSASSFREMYLARSPVVLTGLAAHWRALGWTAQRLKERFARAKLPVRMDDQEFEAYCQATRDHAMLIEKEARRVAVKDLSFWVIELDAYFDAVLRGDPAAERLPCILDVPLSRRTIMHYLQVMKIDDAEDWSSLLAACEGLIGDVSFPNYLAGERDHRFWFTPRPRSRGTIHADGYHNFNAQIRGRKEWILQSPEQRRNGEALTCCTEAGEILYIPKGYWHAAKALESSINVNAWHTIPG